MGRIRLILLTALVMSAFAGNSLLCRLALTTTAIDPASFTSLRILSAALALWLLANRNHAGRAQGSWLSALALFGYATGFSFAYRQLSAATGALLLFGAVQLSMIGYGLSVGERLNRLQLGGLLLALSGLVVLLLPGVHAPPLTAALLMLGAGVSWGTYSLRGRAATDPAAVTSGNFLRAAPLTVLLSLWQMDNLGLDPLGCGYALVSGALASGLVYLLWYRLLPNLTATGAASVQLSVPILAALGGILWLGEPLTLRFLLASLATLGGIYLVFRQI